MEEKIPKAKEYYEGKPMLVRYIVLGFLLIIIAIQLVLPRWKKIAQEQVLENPVTSGPQQIQLLLFGEEVETTGQYLIFQQKIAQIYNTITPTEKKNFQKYLQTNIAQSLKSSLKKAKIPREFIVFPWILSQGNPRYQDGQQAGILALTRTEALQAGLQVNDMVDQRLNSQLVVAYYLEKIQSQYKKYKDWNVVVFSLFSNKVISLGEEQEEDLQSLSQDEQEENNTYTGRGIDNLFTILVYTTLAQHPEWAPVQPTQLPTTTKRVRGPISIYQWCKNERVPYMVVRLLNPWVKGDQLPKGRRNIVVPN